MSGSIWRAKRALVVLLVGATLISGNCVITAPAHASEQNGNAISISKAIADSLVEIRSADFTDELKSKDYYFAQSGSGRCTITSIAMMVKRAARLDGRDDWRDISEASVTADGWVYGVGVKNAFSTAGYRIDYIGIEGTPEALADMLKNHPEGIAVYDPGVPHAVLLTDYDESTGIFYCADPAGYYSGKRMPLAESWNGSCHGKSQEHTIAGFSRAWVITA